MRRGAVLSKDKTQPGYPECVWQLLLCKKIVTIVAYAQFTLTPGSINGFQCCQVSKRRLALFTNLALLCLTRWCGETSEVRWEMYIWYKSLAILLSTTYQRLLKV